MNKRWRVCLVVVLVLLAASACGKAKATPTATRQEEQPTPGPASLERERREVWHRPSGQDQREVQSPTTAHDGDRVWTEALGRALLKWPDLHVRLYRETSMQVEDVTPTWIVVALDAGTALNSATSRLDQRLVWNTDFAEITLTGTTIQVTHVPEFDVTLVRVFDGRAEVQNLTGDPRTESVGTGEWALVEPRQPPQVSEDLEELRDFVRDLGLWDVFHEVERDVWAGFGPEPVPSDEVEIVFVESEREADPDGDGLTSAEEEELGTDPYNPDTDGDDLPDGREAPSCTDPLDWDTDGDGRGDGEEVEWRTDPCDPADRLPGERDDDGDGLANAQEWELGTDPEDPDTDGDDLWDGLEVLEFETDPLNPDTDDDGLRDGSEASGCTDPVNPDTDGDGWNDAQEIEQGTDPCEPDAPSEATPDLIAEIFSIDNQEIVWGEQPWSWIHYRVCNVGNGDLPTGPVYLQAWANGSPTSGYMVVQGPLASDSCTESKFAVGHDSGWPPDEYTVRLEVDHRELIEESDEDNNISNSQQFIVVAPESAPETTGRIVFVSERTGSPQIWVMNADGSNQEQLTRQGRNAVPQWSPDNRQILFERRIEGGWITYIMNADGTEQRPLLQNRWCVSAGYSSRGQLSYACWNMRSNWELFVANKRITYNNTDDRLYTWSPLGDRIVFEAREEGDQYRVLMRVDANGDGLLRLTDPDYQSWNAAWSPDAERLAFASNRDGNARIFTMLTDGTQWRALTSSDRWSQLPTWSPDGRWITFVSSDTDEVWSLYRIDTIGDRQIRLSRYAHPWQFPSWSPDSRRLAFASDADGDFEIFVIGYDGTETVQLTENSSDDHSPQWSR
jgi:Tol biopolymer transport system component